MKLAGANVYLYLLNPNPQPGELKSKVPPHLLHPKQLLFDYKDEPAELWVGSHNWTARALTGVNIEASLRVRLSSDSKLYADAAAFLDAIRANCVPFDVTAVNYYKWLQQSDQEEEIWVVELREVRSGLPQSQNSGQEHRHIAS
jgi:HKD family nuclease